MSGKGTQKATPYWGTDWQSFYRDMSQTLIEWSVQGSNLRPPVNVIPARAGVIPHSPHPIVAKPRPEARRAGETAASTGNGTAIVSRPDIYADSRIFLVWDWAI